VYVVCICFLYPYPVFLLVVLLLLSELHAHAQQELAAWIDCSWSWLLSLGIQEQYLSKSVHAGDKLAHYARACTDIMFKFPFGVQELMGVAARGNYDLTQHATHSGTNMEYFDPIAARKFIPHVIEPSIGVDRLFLALLCSAYREEVVENEKRVVLGFHPSVAPIKVSVMPLVGNKPEITAKARQLYAALQSRYMVDYDASGAIGRRYRRADECGTPFCVTIDFDSLEDNAVTVRERDSMAQTRIKIADLGAFLSKEIDGFEL
jgi:glycyl-tRNA synthetase